MDAQNDGPSPRAGASRQRRIILIAMVAFGLLGLGAIGHRVWRKYFAPRTPPITDTTGMDPEVADALNARRKAVLDQPRSAEAWGLLGATLKAHGLSRADPCFNEAQRLDPKDYRWPYLIGKDFLEGKPEIAIPRLRLAATLCGNEPAPRLTLGEVLLDRGEPVEAESLLKTGLDKGALNAARAHLGLGRIALERQDLEHAVEHLRLAVAGAPGAKSAHVALAQAYHRQGDTPAAENEQRIAAQLKTGNTVWPDPVAEFVDRTWVGMKARMNRINQFDQRGFREEAIVLSRQTVARYPDSAVARLVLGEMLNKSRSYVAAEAALRDAVQMDTNRSKAFFELGYALQAQGKIQASVEPYRRALELRGDFAPAHYNLGLALETLKDEPGALEEIKSAIRHQPDYVDAHLALASLLERRAEHKEAIAHAEEAARLAPADPRPKRVLAELRAKDPKPGSEGPTP